MEENKLSYEELEKQNQSLTENVRRLQNQLMQVQNLNNTLHWLFKAIKYKEAFKPEFIESVTSYVESTLTPPKK